MILPFSIKHKVEANLQEKLEAGILVPIDNPIVACLIVPVIKADGQSEFEATTYIQQVLSTNYQYKWNSQL
jgi:hypothetical protein